MELNRRSGKGETFSGARDLDLAGIVQTGEDFFLFSGREFAQRSRQFAGVAHVLLFRASVGLLHFFGQKLSGPLVVFDVGMRDRGQGDGADQGQEQGLELGDQVGFGVEFHFELGWCGQQGVGDVCREILI